MEKLTAANQLDEFLLVLTEHCNEHYFLEITTLRLQYNLRNKCDISVQLLQKMGDKLVSDKYITWNNDITPSTFTLTFEGICFIQSGGYSQKVIDDESARELRDSRDRRLSNGTVYLAIGTFALVVWEVVKTFFLEK